MRRLLPPALAAGLLTAGLLAGPALALDGPVRTQDGLLQGVRGMEDGVTAFLGVPFAAPPVGGLRWAAPQAPAAWEGVRTADTFGGVCPQPTGQGRLNIAVDLPDSPAQSEDCLYLNLWTPAEAAGEALPVMVWIYGGAYNEGAGSSPHNWGDQLAAKGVVLVNFNYRLGALGFLSHPELSAESGHGASGNYALMDAIAVLEWVRDNIAAFGGDPGNVTIFGESAGAAIAAGLTGSPAASGLFHRAIAESGGWMGLTTAPMRDLASAEGQTLETMGRTGLATLADLRALPVEEATRLRGQGMIADGHIIPEDLSLTFAQERQNAVDVIVGSNRDEGFFAYGGPGTGLEAWRDGAARRWGDLTPLGEAAYPVTDDAGASEASMSTLGDNLAWHMRLFAQRQAATGAQSWLYYFTHEPPYAEERPHRAVHTAEIPYVFNNLAAVRVYPDGSSPDLAAASATERAFADQVSSYWVNFARTGNPNGPGLPRWPAFGELGPTEAMLLDGNRGSGPGEAIGQPKLDLYDAIYARQTGAAGVQ